MRICLRQAIREAVAWRIGDGRPLGERQLVAAALAALGAQPSRLALPPHRRARCAALLERTTRRFCSSALGRRLLMMDARAIVALLARESGADVAVRDRVGRLHVIGLTGSSSRLRASDEARRIARRIPVGAADRLRPITVHLYSLPANARFPFNLRADDGASASTRAVA